MKKIALALTCALVFITTSVFALADSQRDTTYKRGFEMINESVRQSLKDVDKDAASKIVVERITPEKLQKLIKDKVSIVYIYGTYCFGCSLGAERFYELQKDNKDLQVIIVSTDYPSKEQVAYIKKLIYKKNIDIKTYIIDIDLAPSMENAVKFATFDHLLSFVNSFDPDFKKKEFEIDEQKIEVATLPYVALFDRKGNVLYKKAYQGNPAQCPTSLNEDEYWKILDFDYDKIKALIKENK